MTPDRFFLEVLYWRIVPSLTTVLLTYGFLVLMARLLGIRQSRWLYWLSVAPLLKGLVVLVAGVPPPPPIPTSRPFMVGMRLWNPFQIPSVPAFERFEPLFDSYTATVAVIALAALLLAALLIRWYSLVAFYRSLGKAGRLAREDAPRVFAMLDRLVPRMGVSYPGVAVSDSNYLLPCTLGARRPVILLPPEMVEESSDEVLEAVLAHELAHVKRRDNILHWPLVLLRDLLFFNPAAHFVFSRIMLTKEKACDIIAARAIEKPAALGQAIYEAAALAVSRRLAPLPGNISGLSSPFRRTGHAQERILSLREPRPETSRVRLASVVLLLLLVLLGLMLNIFIRAPYPTLLPAIQF